ncbi:hypothetical protein R4Z09_12440 [Niallia oryzisoli]|uniref:IPT/TIG domain-containing protein n=1 Tax=Niallia oryzisoli TaxID=1737571 RepID=A0ABZ2CJ07_9BACI
MFRRPTCMQQCLDAGHDADYCRTWCEPIYMVPTYPYNSYYPYSMPTTYAPMTDFGISQTAPVIQAAFKYPRPHPDWVTIVIRGEGFTSDESITIEIRTFIRGVPTYSDSFDRQADGNGVLYVPERAVSCRRAVLNQSVEVTAYGVTSGASNKVVLYC